MLQRFEIREQLFGVVALVQFLVEGHAAGDAIGEPGADLLDLVRASSRRGSDFDFHRLGNSIDHRPQPRKPVLVDVAQHHDRQPLVG